MIAIIKYNAGNTKSVLYALERLGNDSIVTDDAQQIQNASKVIFPGVGEASTAMKYLRENKLDNVIKNLKQPVLGICLGMQLLCNYSEENNTECLGIFDTTVKKFNVNYKVPHVGWNRADGKYFYFLHSYYAELCRHTVTISDYGIAFSSVLQKNNFYGTQFHPEKSGEAGEQFLKNFLKI